MCYRFCALVIMLLALSLSGSARELAFRTTDTQDLQLAVGLGAGGDAGQMSLSGQVVRTTDGFVDVGFGLGLMLPEFMMDHVYDYPAPHADISYYDSRKGFGFVAYGISGVKLADDLHLNTFYGAGILSSDEIYQSDSTGRLYNEYSTTHGVTFTGMGLTYRNLFASYDNMRGVTLGITFP